MFSFVPLILFFRCFWKPKLSLSVCTYVSSFPAQLFRFLFCSTCASAFCCDISKDLSCK